MEQEGDEIVVKMHYWRIAERKQTRTGSSWCCQGCFLILAIRHQISLSVLETEGKGHSLKGIMHVSGDLD